MHACVDHSRGSDADDCRDRPLPPLLGGLVEQGNLTTEELAPYAGMLHTASSPPAQHGEEVDRADEAVGAWSRGT